jgi:large subunit ribosomal protein L10
VETSPKSIHVSAPAEWRVFARQHREAKTFVWKGGECTLAVTKKRKQELVAEYRELLSKSKAVIITEYTGLTMKQIDDLRSKIREVGGEFHVVKNTLGRLAFEEAGFPVSEKLFEGSTAAGFAFDDAAALAKMMSSFTRTNDALKIKGGYLDMRPMKAAQVTALADLPSLPVMRAQLLGTIMAPASQLARVLAEPARQVAAVVKAYAEKDAIPSAS